MTSSPDEQPEPPGPEREPAPAAPKRISGLAVAALAIAVFTLVSDIAAWVALLIVTQRPLVTMFAWISHTPLNPQTQFVSIPPYPDFVVLAGVIWLAVLPIASVGLVFARAARLRDASGGRPVPGVRASTIITVIALLLAIGGLTLFYFRLS